MTHLDKAKKALEDAAEMGVDLACSAGGEPPRYTRLLDLALTQAALAQAEEIERLCLALERIADHLDWSRT